MTGRGAGHNPPGTVLLTCGQRNCNARVRIVWAHLENITANDYLCHEHRRGRPEPETP